MTRFIHHPAEIPILISSRDSTDGYRARLCNIGEEGITCRLPHALSPGDAVTLQFPSLTQECRLSGRVEKCDRLARGFGVSILFTDKQEAFKSKMVEQVCQIEHYRRELLKDGRALDSNDAAQEWIERYSEQFSKTFLG